MTDHIARVREQAEKASREAYDFNGVRGHDSRNGTRRKAFIAGAVWAAERVTPTREKLVAYLRTQNVLLGGMNEAVAEEQADAILALLAEPAASSNAADGGEQRTPIQEQGCER